MWRIGAFVIRTLSILQPLEALVVATEDGVIGSVGLN